MQNLAQVLDLLPEVVYRLDREGKITYVNEAIRVFGYNPPELIGVPVVAIIHPGDRDRCRRQLNERRTGDRRTRSLEVHLLTRGQSAAPPEARPAVPGEPTVLHLDAVGVYDAGSDGEPVWAGTIGVARDVTGQRRLEEERQSLNRIQDVVADMRNPDDIGKVVGVVAYELRRLGMEFRRLGINVVEPGEDEPRVRTYHPSEPTAEDAPYTYQTAAVARIIHRIWQEQKTIYRRNLEEDDPLGEWPVVSQGTVVRRSIVDVPFSHGTLALSHPQADAFSDRQIAFLDQVALSLTTSFTRLDDLVDLADQRNRYRALFTASGEAILVLAEDRVIECNPRSLELLACRREDLIGASPADFAPSLQPDGRTSDAVIRESLAHVHAGERQVIPFVHRRTDGKVLDTEVTLCLVELDRRPCVLATIRDYTDRTRLSSLYDTELAGFFRVELSTSRLADCNERFAEMLGYRDQPACLREFTLYRHVKHPEGRPRVEDLIERGLRRSIQWEGQVRRLDGMLFWCQIVIGMSRDGHCLEGFGLDVTDRVQAQQALLRSSRLAAMGELAAGLAHELRQPLTVISTIAQGIELSLEGETPALSKERLHDHLSRVLGQVDRIDGLIEHVRLFSRDRRDGSAAPFDAAAAVRNTLLLIGRRLANHQIDVKVEIDDNLPLARGNPYRLEEAILTLLTNALDALESVVDRCRVVWVTARQDGAWVVIEVADNGPGVPENYRSRLFEPFFTTKPDTGTGLGLSVAQATLREHGGQLDYQSRNEEGARFLIRLPATA